MGLKGIGGYVQGLKGEIYWKVNCRDLFQVEIRIVRI